MKHPSIQSQQDRCWPLHFNLSSSQEQKSQPLTPPQPLAKPVLSLRSPIPGLSHRELKRLETIQNQQNRHKDLICQYNDDLSDQKKAALENTTIISDDLGLLNQSLHQPGAVNLDQSVLETELNLLLDDQEVLEKNQQKTNKQKQKSLNTLHQLNQREAGILRSSALHTLSEAGFTKHKKEIKISGDEFRCGLRALLGAFAEMLGKAPSEDQAEIIRPLAIEDKPLLEMFVRTAFDQGVECLIHHDGTFGDILTETALFDEVLQAIQTLHLSGPLADGRDQSLAIQDFEHTLLSIDHMLEDASLADLLQILHLNVPVISISGGHLEIYEPLSTKSREESRAFYQSNKALQGLIQMDTPIILLDQGHFRLFIAKLD